MNDAWKELLESSQFDEGRELYKAGMVKHIEGSHNKYNVIVKDGRDYTVSIFMVGSKLLDMTCSCKEAESLGYCKHGTASLFALAEKGLIRLNVCDPTVLVTLIRNLNNRYSDEDGWIEKRWSPVFAERFEKILHDMLFDLMNQRDYLSAFEILKAAFMVLNEIRMYDESTQYEISLMLEKDWDNIIHRAPDEEKDVMFDWFVQMLPKEKELICGESISFAFYNLFDEPKYIRVQLDEIRKELKNPENVENLGLTLDTYRNYLERCHLDLDEYEKWLEEHDTTYEVKIRLLNFQVEKGKYRDAIPTAEHYLKNERIHPAGLRWETTLLDLYQKTGDTNKEREILNHMLLEDKYPDFRLMNELRSICDKEQWDRFRTAFLQKYPNKGIEIFGNEITNDELLKTLEYASKDKIDAYSTKLIDQYPEKFIKIYSNLLYRLVGRKANKTILAQMKECLLKMSKISKGKEAVEKLIDQWERKYSHRTTMMKMLEEVKDEIDYHPQKRTIEQPTLDLW
ncbi:MAG: hypothetical protein J6E46_13650 [Faecalicoccus sp.]|nr:hypothetical protein [Faecalicoccus sp.]